jgi:hypothetical protein
METKWLTSQAERYPKGIAVRLLIKRLGDIHTATKFTVAKLGS